MFDFEAEPGLGLKCSVTHADQVFAFRDNRTLSIASERDKPEANQKYNVLVGNRKWMEKNELPIPDGANETMEEFEREGNTVVMAAINGKFHRRRLRRDMLSSRSFSSSSL